MDGRWWTDEELVALSAVHGHAVSERQLERWHKAAVLPRPMVDFHVSKGTASYYPPGTDAYVLTVCRLKADGKGRPLWRLRFELWWEGFAIPLAALEDSFARLLAPSQQLGREPGIIGTAEDALTGFEAGQDRTGVLPHVRRALRGHKYEAQDLLVTLFRVASGAAVDLSRPIDHAVSPRSLADALGDVLVFDGTSTSTPLAQTVWGEAGLGGISNVLGSLRSNPTAVLTRLDDDRLGAVRATARAIVDHLPVIARAEHVLKGRDVAGSRFLCQIGAELGRPDVRASAVLTIASTPAGIAELEATADTYNTLGRQHWAMLTLLEAVPESNLLSGGITDVSTLSDGEREAIGLEVRAFLEANPDVDAAL